MSGRQHCIDYDSYNADDAEQDYLSSKPISFLILGKPGSGRKALGEVLAKAWHCVHINAYKLIKERLESEDGFNVISSSLSSIPVGLAPSVTSMTTSSMLGNTDVGLKALVDVQLLTDKEIFSMIRKAIMSSVVSHRGYVLTDFPSLDNKSMSFGEQMELIKRLHPRPDFVIYIKMDSDDIVETKSQLAYDFITETTYWKGDYEEKPRRKKSVLPLVDELLKAGGDGSDDDDDTTEEKRSSSKQNLEEEGAIEDGFTDDRSGSEKPTGLDSESFQEPALSREAGDEPLSTAEDFEDEVDPEALKKRRVEAKRRMLDKEAAAQQPTNSLPPEVQARLVRLPEFTSYKVRPVLELYTSTVEPIVFNELFPAWSSRKIFMLNGLKTAQVLVSEVLERLKSFHCQPAHLVCPVFYNVHEVEEREQQEKKVNSKRESRMQRWRMEEIEELDDDDSSSVLGRTQPGKYPASILAAAAAFPSKEGDKKVISSSVPREIDNVSVTFGGELDSRRGTTGTERSAMSSNAERRSKAIRFKNVSEDEKEAKSGSEELELTSDRQSLVGRDSEHKKAAMSEEENEELTSDNFFAKLAKSGSADLAEWKWRKSKWMNLCPVALSRGQMIQGKMKYAARFLEKVYALSSESDLKAFMENPRPYLKAPRPKNHCKVLVTGLPYSGRTTLSRMIAQRYRAKVIDVEELMKPALREMKERFKDYVTEKTITDMRLKISSKTAKNQRKKNVMPVTVDAKVENMSKLTSWYPLKNQDSSRETAEKLKSNIQLKSKEKNNLANEEKTSDEEVAINKKAAELNEGHSDKETESDRAAEDGDSEKEELDDGSKTGEELKKSILEDFEGTFGLGKKANSAVEDDLISYATREKRLRSRGRESRRMRKSGRSTKSLSNMKELSSSSPDGEKAGNLSRFSEISSASQNMSLDFIEEKPQARDAEEKISLLRISANDPDVQEIVGEFMAKFVPKLSPRVLLSLVEEEVIRVQKELSCEKQEAVFDGGFVLDNFPLELPFWELLMKRPIVRPTSIFYLDDISQRREIVVSRWYDLNRREVNQKIIARLMEQLMVEIKEERKKNFVHLVTELQEGEILSLDPSSIANSVKLDRTPTSRTPDSPGRSLRQKDYSLDHQLSSSLVPSTTLKRFSDKSSLHNSTLTKASGSGKDVDNNAPKPTRAQLQAWAQTPVNNSEPLTRTQMARSEWPLDTSETSSEYSGYLKDDVDGSPANSLKSGDVGTKPRHRSKKSAAERRGESGRRKSPELLPQTSTVADKEPISGVAAVTSKLGKSTSAVRGGTEENKKIPMQSETTEVGSDLQKELPISKTQLNESQNAVGGYVSTDSDDGLNRNFNAYSSSSSADDEPTPISIRKLSKPAQSFRKSRKRGKSFQLSQYGERPGQMNVFLSLGLPFDQTYEHLLRGLSQVVIFKRSLAQSFRRLDPLQPFMRSRVDDLYNLRDNLPEPATIVEEIPIEEEIDGTEFSEVTCLIQQLLNVTSYIPLAGPEKTARMSELGSLSDQWTAINAFLSGFDILVKTIVIGREIKDKQTDVVNSLFMQSNRSDHSVVTFAARTSPGSSKMPKNPTAEKQVTIRGEKIFESYHSAASVVSPKSVLKERGARKADEDAKNWDTFSVDNESTGTRSFRKVSSTTSTRDSKVRKFLTQIGLAAQAKYFDKVVHDLDELVTKKWKPRDSFDILDVIVGHMEEQFKYKAVEGFDLERTETEEREEKEEILESEINNVDPFLEHFKDYKNSMGDTSHFCPVTLRESKVMTPGNKEFMATYREGVYFFASSREQRMFIKNPEDFVAQKKPIRTPPTRLLIAGPAGSGKSTVARQLTNKYGLCHIQFKEFLQEMVISKTKMRVQAGKEDEDEEEPEDFDMLGEDEVKERLRSTGKLTWENKKSNADLRFGLGYDESEPNSGSLAAMSGYSPFEKNKMRTSEIQGALVLSEKEQQIVAYLTSLDDPSASDRHYLPDIILDEILKLFWNGKRFKNAGFVLEGFPNDTEELEQMTRLGLYPDACLVLDTDSSEAVGRLLPEMLKKWKEKRQRKLDFKRKLKDTYDKLRKEALETRRKDLVQEKAKLMKILNEKSRGSMTKGVRFVRKQEMTGEKLEDLENIFLNFDVNQILAEEFDEDSAFEEDDEEEKEAEAEERIRSNIVQTAEIGKDMLPKLVENFKEKLIPAILIDASKRLATVSYKLGEQLEPFLKKRQSAFETVIPVSLEVAEKLLLLGYKHLSRFNRSCPVKLLEDDFVQARPNDPVFPAIHRSFVYFLSSKEALEAFVHNPLQYLCKSQKKRPIPVKLAILGPPKSGKTTIAERLSEEFGIKRLSMGEALRSFLNSYSRSNLARKIRSLLHKGQTVSDDLATSCLDVVLMDLECNVYGYVLDGYPVTEGQLESLEGCGIVPFRVIHLKITEDQIRKQAAASRIQPKSYIPHDNDDVLEVKLEAYKIHEPPLLAWYSGQRNNLHEIPMERSRWWVWNRVLDVIKQGLDCVQNYYDGISRDGVASLVGMALTPTEFRKNLGACEEFCPVSYVDNGEFVDCSTRDVIDYAAEFKRVYYRLAGEAELTKFLRNHTRYVGDISLPPSQCRPIRKTREAATAAFGTKQGLLGFCPVTYFEGDQLYTNLIRGNPDFAVEYLKTVYYFTSESNLLKFMRSPQKYHSMKDPTLIPPDLPPLKATGLPIPGYLEQSVSQDLIKALTACGNLKPKYPFLSAQQSAVLYVAYFLKANNQRNTVFSRKRFHQKLKDFEERCDLIRYLSSNMGRQFKDETERPSGFDAKLDEFFQLEQAKVQLFPNKGVESSIYVSSKDHASTLMRSVTIKDSSIEGYDSYKKKGYG